MGMTDPMRDLAHIAERCAKETDRFFRGQDYDPQHCFELFRRAILEQDGRAWEAIYAQYGTLVGRWVQQHSGFQSSGEEVQYFVNRAYEKIWAALTPEKFERFPELGGLLRYLKMCVHSVISDYNRVRELSRLMELEEEPAVEAQDPQEPVEERAIERATRMDFWKAIQSRLNDEQERCLVYGAFILALKPRQIHEQFNGMFESVDEVYRVKQNVLARLRRDPEIGNLLAGRD